MRQRLRSSSPSPGAAPPAVAPEALQQSLRLLLDALSEFVRHANATEMPADVSFRLPGIGCLAMARLVDFTIWSDDRDCPGEVAVIFHCRGDDALETWPATTAQYFETRDYLLGHHLRCPEAVAGVPSSIVIAPEVPVEALFRADYAAGIVEIVIRNLEVLGTKYYGVEPARLNADLIGEIEALLSLRESNFAALVTERTPPPAARTIIT